MIRFIHATLIVIVLLAGSWISVQAQSVQFLPEVATYITFSHYARAYLQAKDDRDTGESDQFSIGPSAQIYLKPLLKLKQITEFDLDDAKRRPLILEAGYRYLTAPGVPTTRRMEVVGTSHFPLKLKALLLDKNSADLDWKNGKFDWRYSNKLTLERTFAIHSCHLIPYIAAEPYYESQYNKWSTVALYAGSQLPVGKHVQFDTYFEHENNTGKSHNFQQNSVGLTLDLYFSLVSK